MHHYTPSKLHRCPECYIASLKSRKSARNASSRAWYYRNHEHSLASNRTYRERVSREHLNEKARKWRANNPQAREYMSKYQKEWRNTSNGRAIIRHHNWLRKQRVRGAEGEHSLEEWLKVIEDQGGLCLGCNGYFGEKLTRDHIVPVVKGGSNSIDNIQGLCKICNSKKGTRCFV